MSFAIVLALVSVFCGHALAGADDYECRYGNGGKGFIQTFFMTDKLKIAPFPCTYLLADFWCGESKVNVTILNTASADENFKPRIDRISVTIRHRANGTTYIENNVLTSANKAKFLKAVEKKKDLDKAAADLWNWVYEGDNKPEKGTEIFGTVDKKKKAMIVEFKSFKVELRYDSKGGNEDEMRIYCAKDDLGKGTHFPNALCGLPGDSQANVERVLKAAKNVPEEIMNGARWDVAMLSRQDAWQNRDYCTEAKKSVDEKCADKKKEQVLADCHEYYNDHLGNKRYGACARRSYMTDEEKKNKIVPLNPMTLYTHCLETLCHEKQLSKTSRDWRLDDKKCSFLQRISSKCNNLKPAGTKIGTLLEIGGCGTA